MTTENADLLRAERDLYRRLLDVGTHEELPAFLDDVMALVVEVTGAEQGYLEVHGPEGAPPHALAHRFSETELANIQSHLSGGIVAEAIKTGQTIATASALDDPRFRDMQSVQTHRIQAVLCAPLGGAAGVGVIYLQGRTGPGPFSERDRQLLELCARHVAPFAERLLRQPDPAHTDNTQELRSKLKVDGLAGRSNALAAMLKEMLVAAGVDITVLVLGESGVGKTEVARALHASSRRAQGPFVEVNCAAIPESLFEAELFGAEKGAHSTATRRMLGKVAAAQNGTLFLDEMGETPLSQQPKLLQLLQSRRYFPLGSATAVEADVRIVAATNQDLAQAVVERRFREDLYYRLNVLTVRVPALRQRTTDVPLLADHLLRHAASALGRSFSFSAAARFALSRADWPGNVRQLSSAVQRAAAVALSENTDVIDLRHVFPDAPAHPSDPLDWQEALRAFQKQFLQDALHAAEGNVTETARRIGLTRSHLHELLRAHGVARARTP
jgi:transcriptional regulator with GAF, ATPase, and Fis domain